MEYFQDCPALWSSTQTVKVLSQNYSQFTIEDNVLKGREVSYHDEYDSLGEFVLRKLEGDPDFVGQIDAISGEEYTYKKMRERSVRCALWMKSQGLRPRDVIALSSDNHLDFAIPCFAALYLGTAFCSLEPQTFTDNILQEMNVIKPKMVFVSESAAAVIAEAVQKAKLIDVKIIVFGRVPGFLEFDSVIAEPDIDEVKNFNCTPIESSNEIASILFSSGTTGHPKAIALSHRALTMLMHQAEAIGMTGKVCFIFTTTRWINMIESIFMTLLLKMPRILLPTFEEHVACALIEKYKTNWAFLTPYMIDILAKCDALGSYDLSSLSQVVFSGNRLSMGSYRALKKLVPNAQITSGYGMTEACGYISMQSSKSQPGSCGKVMENAQVKIIDPDTGRTLKANEKGELLLKFVCMMNCYYNNPLATANLIDDQGWMHSGDIGYYDESGEIFLIDRLKDILIYADVPVSPSEFEDVILSHPGVKEVAVVGQHQPNGYDLPIAFVVRTENYSDTGEQVTETDIMNLVVAKLQDPRKQLHAGVRFIDHLPKTSSDKIKRRILHEMAKATVTI